MVFAAGHTDAQRSYYREGMIENGSWALKGPPFTTNEIDDELPVQPPLSSRARCVCRWGAHVARIAASSPLRPGSIRATDRRGAAVLRPLRALSRSRVPPLIDEADFLLFRR